MSGECLGSCSPGCADRSGRESPGADHRHRRASLTLWSTGGEEDELPDRAPGREGCRSARIRQTPRGGGRPASERPVPRPLPDAWRRTRLLQLWQSHRLRPGGSRGVGRYAAVSKHRGDGRVLSGSPPCRGTNQGDWGRIFGDARCPAHRGIAPPREFAMSVGTPERSTIAAGRMASLGQSADRNTRAAA